MAATDEGQPRPTAEGPAETTAYRSLEEFLAAVERRAFRTAMIATRQRDDAFDIVQDAMCKLVQNYRNRPSSEWGPLFQTILQSRITDYHRRKKFRGMVFGWWDRHGTEDDESPLDNAEDPAQANPLNELSAQRAADALEQALQRLPLRQQQAFMLRSWEGFDVATTAKVMGCSEGSVKTHLSRALHALRDCLGEDWP